MTTMLGEYALGAAMLTCVAVMLAAVAYPQTKNEGLLRCVRWGLGLIAGFLAISSFSLIRALLSDDFSLAYVAEHSEKSLATAYKGAAFWAGQEGSMLFWALVLGLMGVVMAWRGRNKNDAEQAVSLGVMAAVTGFFTAVMLFAGNPFEQSVGHVLDGSGSNPMLQNFAMVIHPPMLFLGYAGFTAPFALLMGALIAGRKDSAWLGEARAWMVYAWIMLTVGIVLGAQWAYVELGWGGYWAWDPVENASILPWFTGTALLHSALMQGRRGIFKRWTAWLTAASFFLCVFGTYLTRSGVIQSVHAFQQSSIGAFFLGFMAVIGVVGAGVILVRGELLETEHPLEGLFSREGAFLLANMLLSLMTVVTLVATIFPIISEWFGSEMTVKAPFYNYVILPMALLLAAVMATGPIIGSGAGAGMRVIRKLAGMAMAGCVAGLGVFGMGYDSVWAMLVAAVIGAVVTAVLMDVVVSFGPKAGTGMLEGIGRQLAMRPRHWGAQLAHLGIAAIVVGVAGSSLYGVTRHVHLATGGAGQVGGYALTLKSLEMKPEGERKVWTATVAVQDTKGQTFELTPKRTYGEQDEAYSSDVAIRFSLGRDVYVTLDGPDNGGGGAMITTIINPLVTWIWIGGGLLTLGGLVCLIPARQPVGAAQGAAEMAADPGTVQASNGLAALKTNSQQRRNTRKGIKVQVSGSTR